MAPIDRTGWMQATDGVLLPPCATLSVTKNSAATRIAVMGAAAPGEVDQRR